MSEVRVPVALGDRSYDVVVAAGALDAGDRHLARFARDRRLVVVTDRTVAACQLPRLTAALDRAGIAVRPIVLADGEGSKSWQALAGLCDELLAAGLERGDHLLALGGGVIGDLAGFAAAILKRGCAYVQVPTTLLAQVDSSVGGKTAINTIAGKNLIGAFHQPAFVLIDPLALATLDRRQLAAGYAEIVKYGLIDDRAFFAWCEAHGAALLAGDVPARAAAIEASVRAKAAIVGADERETGGRRALLNLGHTFGHALEAATGMGGRLLHGEAVAAGMALAFRFSVGRGLCAPAEADRVAAHLRAVGLPASLADAGVAEGGAALVAHMMHDKKREGGVLPLLLARGIGRTFVARDVAPAEIARFLDDEHPA